MRPRVIPADDTLVDDHRVDRESGFNEAAGYPRG